MHIIKLDASTWSSVEDFYDAVLPAIGAPEKHGRSINALIDSIVGGNMNSLEPPYVILISNTAHLDKADRDHLAQARFYLAKARAETREEWGTDADVTIEIVD